MIFLLLVYSLLWGSRGRRLQSVADRIHSGPQSENISLERAGDALPSSPSQAEVPQVWSKRLNVFSVLLLGLQDSAGWQISRRSWNSRLSNSRSSRHRSNFDKKICVLDRKLGQHLYNIRGGGIRWQMIPKLRGLGERFRLILSGFGSKVQQQFQNIQKVRGFGDLFSLIWRGLGIPIRFALQVLRQWHGKESGAELSASSDAQQLSAKPSPSSDAQQLSAAMGELLAETGNDQDFQACAKLILRVCDNIAEHPDEPKFRRIQKNNSVFERYLSGRPAALEFLRVIGFSESLVDNNVLEAVDLKKALLRKAIAVAEDELHFAQMRCAWPVPVQDMARTVCEELRAEEQALFSELTAELQYEKIPQLLAEEETLKEVKLMLQGGPTVIGLLVEQLREMREGVGASKEQGPSRVRAVGSAEEWYDLLMDSKGLLVADFSATWCEPCQEVKPLFEELSVKPEYADVTFVSVDIDELPVIAGDQMISSYPTFKFYRDSAEEDLPVEGADIIAVEEKIIALQ